MMQILYRAIVEPCPTATERAILTDTHEKREEATHHQRLRTGGWSLVAVYTGDAHPPHLDNRWTSQVGQDKTIADIFGQKTGGYFVDLAANDASKLSNTLTLEQQFNWTGLCIEPNPVYASGFHHRKCQLVQAAVGKTENDEVTFALANEFGGVVGFDNKDKGQQSVTFKTVSLGKVLDDLGAPSVIDYFSLDIEGAEWWVMESFPWDKYIFLTATIERPNEELQAALREHGYTHVCDHDGFGDMMWVHSSLPDVEAIKAKYMQAPDCRTGRGEAVPHHL